MPSLFRRQVGGQLLILGDQAVNSASNFVVIVIVARSLDAAAFSAFAVAQAVVLLFQVSHQAAYVDQVLRETPELREDLFLLAQTKVKKALGVSLALAGVLAMGAIAVPQTFDIVFLPVVLFSTAAIDAMRSLLVTRGAVGHALAGDLVFAGGQVSSLCVLAATDTFSVFLVWATWGVSAGFGALYMWLAARQIYPRRSPTNLKTKYSARLALEALFVQGAGQTAMLVVAPFVTSYFLGSYRGAQSLFGPVNTAYVASRVVLMPWLARPHRLGAVVTSGLILPAVTGVCAVVLLRLPDSVGQQLLGQTWPAAHELLPWMAALYMAQSAYTWGFYYCRAQRRDNVTAVARLVQVGVLAVAVIATVVTRNGYVFLGGSTVSIALATMLFIFQPLVSGLRRRSSAGASVM